MNTGQVLKWGIALALPLAVLVLLQGAALTPQGIQFFAVTVFIACIWGFDLLPATMAAIALCVLYILLGIAKPAQVFEPWASTVPWITVGGLFFADVVKSTGLAQRIALKCILLVGCSMTRLFVGMALAGFILSLLVPSIIARVVMFVAIGVAFCQSLELDAKSKASSAIILMAYAAGAHTCQAIYTGANVSIIVVSHLQKAGFEITFMDFFLQNIFISIPYALLSIGICRWLLGHNEKLRPALLRNMVEQRLATLGPITGQEIKGLALLISGMVIFATEHIHKMPGAYIFLGISLLGFLPGINLLNEKSLGRINFSVVIFIALCMGIGSAAQAVNADKWVAAQLLTLVAGGSGMFVNMCSYLFGIAINFLLTPVAAVASLSTPLIELARETQVQAPSVLYCFLYGLDQYVFPYEYAPFLYTFTCGYITLKHVAVAMLGRMLAVAVLIMAVGFPLWSYFKVM